MRLMLDHPPLNVLSRELDRAVAHAVREANADPTVAAIILGGASGTRGFSAGVEVADHVPGSIEGMLEDFHGVVRALWEADVPSVAAVRGLALGGGFELALACDLVVAETDARLGLPEIALGCYPPVAAALLPARAGWAAACELVLGGEPFTADRALSLGLINRVCAPGALDATVDALLAPILSRSPAVVRAAKRALRDGASASYEAALKAIELRYLTELMGLADAEEGVRAFMEKRVPRWNNG